MSTDRWVPRAGATTTHAHERAGRPRLMLKLEDRWEGQQQPVYWLDHPMVLIGSNEICDIVLPGIEHVHTMVFNDDDDEYVLSNCGPLVRVHGAPVATSAILRTGARVDIGEHCLAFFREEYADHGRPFGGRIGGEFGHQYAQPPRSAIQANQRDR